MTTRRWGAGLVVAAALSLSAAEARAFCGFYVSGADAKLFNNATLVVLMRDGTRTVLSMQNNYEGPPENFAMVVPVPVVLHEANVKTLPREIFSKVDQLAAPRLVEYWEQDPCAQRAEATEESALDWARRPAPASKAALAADDYGVTIEAQFTVGEYEIVILSAKDSSGLDAWLKDNKYKIPTDAEPVLRPYVESGMKFFVAKVNVEKVKFEKRDGKDMAMLSPLRFHYDDDKFSLPVRLGLLNSSGKQDLLVHVLAPGKRYEVANYPNVTIPTNLDVAESVRSEFGAFYAALFDRTLEENPKAVVTEYAWDASTCDPCPGPALQPGELMSLGADVLFEGKDDARPRLPQVQVTADGDRETQRHLWTMQSQLRTCYQRTLESDKKAEGEVKFSIETDDRGNTVSTKASGGEKLPAQLLTCARGSIDAATFPGLPKKKLTVTATFKSIAAPPPMNFTLTRLHARYGKESLGEDLVFKEAKPIAGGRETRAASGKLEHGSSDAPVNNFQGRYAIRHPWTGPIACKNPVRGVWGGPPSGKKHEPVKPALDLAFAPRGKTDLVSFLMQDVPELKISGKGPGLHDPSALKGTGKDSGGTAKGGDDDKPPSAKTDDSGCLCGAAGSAPAGGLGAALLAAAMAMSIGRRLRRRR